MYRSLPISSNLRVILAISATIFTFLAIILVLSDEVFNAPNFFNETRFKAGFNVCDDNYITEPLKKNVSLSVHICCNIKAYAKCLENRRLPEDAEKVNEFALKKRSIFLGLRGPQDCAHVSAFDCLDPVFIKVYFGFAIFFSILSLSLCAFVSILVEKDDLTDRHVDVLIMEDMETLI